HYPSADDREIKHPISPSCFRVLLPEIRKILDIDRPAPSVDSRYASGKNPGSLFRRRGFSLTLSALCPRLSGDVPSPVSGVTRKGEEEKKQEEHEYRFRTEGFHQQLRHMVEGGESLQPVGKFQQIAEINDDEAKGEIQPNQVHRPRRKTDQQEGEAEHHPHGRKIDEG